MKRDTAILFATRIIRMFAYGFLSVVLALYLSEAGLSESQIGLLLTLTLIGDAVISLWLTTSADRIGRRRILVLGAGLMILAGVVFVLTHNLILLTLAAIIGVISPSGNEIGPFLSIEQAGLTQLVPINNVRRPLPGTIWQARLPPLPVHYPGGGCHRDYRQKAGPRWIPTVACLSATRWQG